MVVRHAGAPVAKDTPHRFSGATSHGNCIDAQAFANKILGKPAAAGKPGSEGKPIRCDFFSFDHAAQKEAPLEISSASRPAATPALVQQDRAAELGLARVAFGHALTGLGYLA
mmetsp:Transcript_57739/g.159680  ORF Transcript_57739/g.159680 Transcript_57739/m.159680 type:complete len:113 (+) Transcript_57739:146-484(+)